VNKHYYKIILYNFGSSIEPFKLNKVAKRKTKKDDFIQKAFYKGGIEAMKDFILGNLKYPPEAASNRVEGTVHVQYEINHKGKVLKAKTLTKHGYGLEEEAIRLVKMLVFEVPQRVRGLRVIFNKTTHIHFRLPKQEIQTNSEPKVEAEVIPPAPAPIQPQVTYTITATPKPSTPTEEEPKKKSDNKTYNYTIRL
jgi:TonB family protein